MCRFKSGIILKTRCIVAQGSNDSHFDLLEKLKISDIIEQAMTKFVKAELTPQNDEWWTNPDTWIFTVDQDILPDWFEIDKEKYEKEFRKSVSIWWNEHVHVDEIIEDLSSGYHRLKRCEVKNPLTNVHILLDDSIVHVIYGNSIVYEMHGNSIVHEIYSNSIVEKMYGSSAIYVMHVGSIVKEMYGYSTVHKIYGNSKIEKMDGCSIVKEMDGCSTVSIMYGCSVIEKMDGSSIVERMYNFSEVEKMYANSMVRKMDGCSKIRKMYDNSIVLNMYYDSIIEKMYGSSIAIVSKNKKIYTSKSSNYEIEINKSN